MKLHALIFVCTMLLSCNSKNHKESSESTTVPIQGTWKLLSGTIIEKGDTSVTDYTKNTSFIKIINATHFAFLNHDLNKGKVLASAVFSAGGGTYTLDGDK